MGPLSDARPGTPDRGGTRHPSAPPRAVAVAHTGRHDRAGIGAGDHGARALTSDRAGRRAGGRRRGGYVAVAMSQTSAPMAASMMKPTILQMVSTRGDSVSRGRGGRLKLAGRPAVSSSRHPVTEPRSSYVAQRSSIVSLRPVTGAPVAHS